MLHITRARLTNAIGPSDPGWTICLSIFGLPVKARAGLFLMFTARRATGSPRFERGFADAMGDRSCAARHFRICGQVIKRSNDRSGHFLGEVEMDEPGSCAQTALTRG